MSTKLSSIFLKIQNELELSGYLKEICSHIIGQGEKKNGIEEILVF